MFNSGIPMKLAAITLAGTVAATTLVPVTTASAHDRGKWHKHHAHKHHWKKHAHRKHYKRHHRGNDTGELIAAGIIGLAIGSIIASSANNSSSHYGSHTPAYTYSDPYADQGSYNGYGRVPLDQYDPGYSGYSTPSGGPNVITYEDTVSLEPWTPGWRAYCEDRYRSFNPQTGTYRGYDGLDHFCVAR